MYQKVMKIKKKNKKTSAHYSNATQEVYKTLNIKFVPKNSNPPNVPQLRPIEHFWALLKERVYSRGWRCETHEELIKRIYYCLSNIPKNIAQTLMESVKTKARRATDHGVLSVIN